jgi:glycerol-3-phosphate dehydrogenase (NAD(P)+)
VGAGAWGTALAVALARSGLDVDLGCSSSAQAELLSRTRENEQQLPGVTLPDRVRAVPADELEPAAHDLVCLAVHAEELPGALAEHAARIPDRAGLLVISTGLVEPHGALPSVCVSEHVPGRAITVLAGPAHASGAPEHAASIVLATHGDRAFGTELSAVLAGLAPLLEGRIAPTDWAATVTRPADRSRKARAA